jgi:ubiquinone/menaquinone biosynthesis C-methylase UbiE
VTKEDKSTAEMFIRYQRSTASYLRYELAQSNLLLLHRLDRPLRILDGASGNGLISAFLLERGHHVTMLDSNPDMLKEAQQLLTKLNVLERCTLIEGDLVKTAELFPPETFDLVLSHHIVEYLENCPVVLSGLKRICVKGGELSLITLNPVSEVVRAAVWSKDPTLVRSKLTDLSFDAHWFGKATLYPREQIIDWAEECGWLLQDFRAIRVLADYIPDEKLTDKELETLLDIEKKLASLEPYRRFGRYIQFSFMKPKS